LNSQITNYFLPLVRALKPSVRIAVEDVWYGNKQYSNVTLFLLGFALAVCFVPEHQVNVIRTWSFVATLLPMWAVAFVFLVAHGSQRVPSVIS
jgi:hypothetical protein